MRANPKKFYKNVGSSKKIDLLTFYKSTLFSGQLHTSDRATSRIKLSGAGALHR